MSISGIQLSFFTVSLLGNLFVFVSKYFPFYVLCINWDNFDYDYTICIRSDKSYNCADLMETLPELMKKCVKCKIEHLTVQKMNSYSKLVDWYMLPNIFLKIQLFILFINRGCWKRFPNYCFQTCNSYLISVHIIGGHLKEFRMSFAGGQITEWIL